MIITKTITEDNELYLYMDGKLVMKRWLNGGYSKVFDVMAYDSYTYASIDDLTINNTANLIHIKAKIKMKPTEEGGRKTGFTTGYRPNHVFEYVDEKMVKTFMGDIQFEDSELIMPGEERVVTVRFLFHQPIEEYLNIGRKWWIHEGGNQLGEAEILEISLPESGKNK